MKKKVKRYVTGDFVDYDSSDDARNLLRAAERETREFKGMDTDVIDETGMKSRLKRNMETGELYDPTGQTMMSKPMPKARPVRRMNMRTAAQEAADDAKIFAANAPAEGRTASGVLREARGKKDPRFTDRVRGGMKKGGMVGSASKRADGCAQRGKTKGRMV